MMSTGDSVGSILARFARLVTFGFRGSRARQMKRLAVCQWIFVAAILFIWFKYNGGFWPRFFGDSYRERSVDVNLLDYFVSANHDGALIKWTRGVNNKESLMSAIAGSSMMLVADVNNDGSVPVMSGTPLISSAMTLDAWLNIARRYRKGIKLEFNSIEAAEISLRKLRAARDTLHMPVQLGATIIGEDRQGLAVGPPLLQADAFLRLSTTQFKESTLALGWAAYDPGMTSGVTLGTERYNWTDVKLMYDVIDRWQVTQPITLVAQARLARHSIPQLKWLMEMTGATLTLYSGRRSEVLAATVGGSRGRETSLVDLLYVRHRLPRHSVFYDIPPELLTQFERTKDDDSHIRSEIDTSNGRSFIADQWRVVKSRDGETIYLGTEAVVMQTGLLLTKVEYEATVEIPIIIRGRVEFLDPSSSSSLAGEDNIDEIDPDIGLAVFLRATQSSRPDSITGIRCFIGISGILKIETRGVPGAATESIGAIPGKAPCFTFDIIDSGASHISVNVSRPKSCNDWQMIDFTNSVSLSMTDVKTEASYIAIRQSISPSGGNKRFTAVDEFTIHSPTRRTRHDHHYTQTNI